MRPRNNDFYRLTNGSQFGNLDFFHAKDFHDQKVVDYLGEPIDEREWLQIGEVGEQAIVQDKASGEVIIYWYTYFKVNWDSGVILQCTGLPELIATVALGPRYREIFGPIEKQKDPWWDEDPWWAYLREVGFA